MHFLRKVSVLVQKALQTTLDQKALKKHKQVGKEGHRKVKYLQTDQSYSQFPHVLKCAQKGGNSPIFANLPWKLKLLILSTLCLHLKCLINAYFPMTCWSSKEHEFTISFFQTDIFRYHLLECKNTIIEAQFNNLNGTQKMLCLISFLSLHQIIIL